MNKVYANTDGPVHENQPPLSASSKGKEVNEMEESIRVVGPPLMETTNKVSNINYQGVFNNAQQQQ